MLFYENHSAKVITTSKYFVSVILRVRDRTNRRLKIVFKVINNFSEKYREVNEFTEDNSKRVCEKERRTVEEVINFAVFI